LKLGLKAHHVFKQVHLDYDRRTCGLVYVRLFSFIPELLEGMEPDESGEDYPQLWALDLAVG